MYRRTCLSESFKAICQRLQRRLDLFVQTGKAISRGSATHRRQNRSRAFSMTGDSSVRYGLMHIIALRRTSGFLSSTAAASKAVLAFSPNRSKRPHGIARRSRIREGSRSTPKRPPVSRAWSGRERPGRGHVLWSPGVSQEGPRYKDRRLVLRSCPAPTEITRTFSSGSLRALVRACMAALSK